MNLERELQKLKREQEQALRAAKEAEQKAQAHRSRLQEAILAQQQQLVSYWTRTVSALLNELGRAVWGENGYTLIEPDGIYSISWSIVHVEGETRWNYQVTLKVHQASPENLSLSPENKLVSASGFFVRGAEEFVCPLSPDALKEALVSAYQSGPQENGLDQYTEVVLAKSPYKKGEYESPNKWLRFFTILTGLSGIGLLWLLFLSGVSAVSEPQSVRSLPISVTVGLMLASAGIGMILLSGLALRLTSFGKRFKRLSWLEKFLAVVAAIPGVLVVFVISAGLILVVIAIMVILEDVERERRIQEIKEGIRRAFR